MIFIYRFWKIYKRIFYTLILTSGISFGNTVTTISGNSNLLDSVKTPYGLLPSIGIGASLGETGIISLWEKKLPSSLNSFGITSSSFIRKDSLINDTSSLLFSVKEGPSVYSMNFPLSLSLYYLTKNYINKISIEISWLRKNFSSTITRADTSIKSDFKYYESMDLFKCFIFFNRGMKIPDKYFLVKGAEKVFFDVGLGISPLVGFSVNKKIDVSQDDERLNEINSSIDLSTFFIHGGAINLRTGITGLKKIDKRSSAIIDVFVDLCANGYFLNHGAKVKIGDIYLQDPERDKSLFWFSTILGIKFNLLRYKHEKV